MLNDITAASMFSYLLVFMTDIGLSPRNAATVMLSGQIADACTTIFAGELVTNLSLFVVAFSVFHVWPSKTTEEVKNQYRWIAYSSIFIGCIFVVVFHIGTKKPRLKEDFREHGHQKLAWTY
ncbi:hypothetical protein LXL04_027709 [Taraxacum kok-saghyz]